MHIFLDNFHQDGKNSAQIGIHQAELRREEKFTDQKSLSISSLQSDYLNIDRRSDCGKDIEIENLVQTNYTFRGGANHSAEKCFKRTRKENEIVCTDCDSDNRHMECTPCKCFRYGYIILLQNVQSHLKITRDGKIKYVSLKELILHCRNNATTAKTTMTRRYMHLLHVCLILTNCRVGILVTVQNPPIRF